MHKAARDLSEFALLIFKLIWEKTISIREKILNIAKYIASFIASPFVKLWMNVESMKHDMKSGGGIKAGLPYLARFVFGKRGLAVTLFNYAAPILSVVFLLNVVTYATSTNFVLKLTVNGEFLGYIRSEQVFLDAEADVLSRVNYFGSNNIIEILPEFSIANAGSTKPLTFLQVADAILENSEYTLKFAYGFFIDGVCYGAFLEADKPVIDDAMQSLLDVYTTGAEDEDISFRNHVEWSEYTLFLDESVVDPQEIISMVTATRRNTDGTEEPYLPIAVTRTLSYDVSVPFTTESQLDDTRFEGQSRVSQQGADGINHVTARVSYVNGVEVSRLISNVEPVKEPVPRITQHGTRPLDEREVAPIRGQLGLFSWPTREHFKISNGFKRGHSAIDISGSGIRGTPVFAAGCGEVIEVHWLRSGYGHYIVIQHGEEYNHLKTLYSHNDEQIVRVGQRVVEGEQIGTVGRTGRADGYHLHFEVIDGSRRLNPNLFLPQR
jgi:murein DD-endopeptidase MepM/ murein hydrolase activator NlpD